MRRAGCSSSLATCYGSNISNELISFQIQNLLPIVCIYFLANSRSLLFASSSPEILQQYSGVSPLVFPFKREAWAALCKLSWIAAAFYNNQKKLSLSHLIPAEHQVRSLFTYTVEPAGYMDFYTWSVQCVSLNIISTIAVPCISEDNTWILLGSKTRLLGLKKVSVTHFHQKLQCQQQHSQTNASRKATIVSKLDT